MMMVMVMMSHPLSRQGEGGVVGAYLGWMTSSKIDCNNASNVVPHDDFSIHIPTLQVLIKYPTEQILHP